MEGVRDSFSFYGTPLDLLRQAIASIRALSGTKYRFSLRRKDEHKDIVVRFFNPNFFHLFGFHKVKELLPYLESRSKSNAFIKITNDQNLLARVALSPSFEDIEGRLVCICSLRELLESAEVRIYERPQERKPARTNIPFDYLAMAKKNGNIMYFFLKMLSPNREDAVLISLFVDNRSQFHLGQNEWKVVSIVREMKQNKKTAPRDGNLGDT